MRDNKGRDAKDITEAKDSKGGVSIFTVVNLLNKKMKSKSLEDKEVCCVLCCVCVCVCVCVRVCVCLCVSVCVHI